MSTGTWRHVRHFPKCSGSGRLDSFDRLNRTQFAKDINCQNYKLLSISAHRRVLHLWAAALHSRSSEPFHQNKYSAMFKLYNQRVLIFNSNIPVPQCVLHPSSPVPYSFRALLVPFPRTSHWPACREMRLTFSYVSTARAWVHNPHHPCRWTILRSSSTTRNIPT